MSLKQFILYTSAAAALAFAVFFLVDPAPAHKAASGFQYPMQCCGEGDCAEVEWEGEKDGKAIVNTKIHSGVEWRGQKETQFLPSPDGKKHLCATPDKAMYKGAYRNVYCLFGTAGS